MTLKAMGKIQERTKKNKRNTPNNNGNEYSLSHFDDDLKKLQQNNDK